MDGARMRMMSKIPAVVVFSGALLLGACGGGGNDNAEQSSTPLSADAQAGKTFAQSNCLGCHTVNGNSASGPTWKGLYGKQRTLTDGSTVVADDAYLHTAMQDPDAQIVQGFPKGVMSAAFPAGKVTTEQANQVIEYIKTLK